MSVMYDRLIHWLVSSLELETTLFHVGQYCGSWRASTAGRSKASFHLVLDGKCYLHIPDRAPIPLEAQDAVFSAAGFAAFSQPL
ncbi:MAG: cupin domain-containing protein [Cellvibrionaceae bacterium]|nr:cupin domain-containing protein [Cellvibrionaceae bacterium]